MVMLDKRQRLGVTHVFLLHRLSFPPSLAESFLTYSFLSTHVLLFSAGWDMFGTRWQYGEREPNDWTVHETPANTVHPYYTFQEQTYAWKTGTVLDFSMDCYENKLTLTWDDVDYVMDVPDVNEAPPCPFLFFYGTELTAIISQQK